MKLWALYAWRGGQTSKKKDTKEMCISWMEVGQPYKLETMLGRGEGRPSRLGEALGKERLEAQESRVCVCEGGEKGEHSSFPLKLEWSSLKNETKAKFLQERPSFYSKILA